LPREHREAIDQLEKLIGYEFRDRELCRNALTHGSRNSKKPDYQRLEFLGDRVLSLIIAEELFKRYRNEQEGQLAARLSLLVRGETCAAVGMQMGLDKFILLGSTEMKKGIQRSGSVLGDVVESLIGALYLDGGLDVGRGFILKQWEERISAHTASLKDAKTIVQEWALGRALPLPHYVVVSREGLEHSPIFTVELRVGHFEVTKGVGASKRASEMAAANEFIVREGIK
jgi:ribonuclease III